jgi:hypothetical protein
MKYISWHHLNKEQQTTAHTWWRSLSINEQKEFVKKHSAIHFLNDVVFLGEFEKNGVNILNVWEKEGRP